MLTHSDFHFRLTYSSSSHSILNGSSFLSWKRCESISSLSPLLFVFLGFCPRLYLRLCLSLCLLWPFPCLCFYSCVSVSVFILNVSFLLSLYLFLVADTQFYKRLCGVRPSVRPSVVIEFENVKTRISAPAHWFATGIGRVSGLVSFCLLFFRRLKP